MLVININILPTLAESKLAIDMFVINVNILPTLAESK